MFTLSSRRNCCAETGDTALGTYNNNGPVGTVRKSINIKIVRHVNIGEKRRSLPPQFSPSPVKPALQSQENDPKLLTQLAFA